MSGESVAPPFSKRIVFERRANLALCRKSCPLRSMAEFGATLAALPLVSRKGDSSFSFEAQAVKLRTAVRSRLFRKNVFIEASLGLSPLS
ncbi:hypothetical protein D3C72_1716950 [compost metagenome]